MTEQDKKITDLGLEIEFYKNEISKCNKVNIELTKQLRIGVVSNRFCLLEESKPPKSGKLQVITNKGRVLNANYDTLCGNDIWEVDWKEHSLNEKVIAWSLNGC